MDILWHVSATWVNIGRKGEMDSVVSAPDAVTALQQFWKVEDNRDLRDVTIRWLTPEDCVVRADE